MVCAACGSAMSAGAKFCSGCGRVVDERAYAAEERRLTRPRAGRKIAGVCAGIAQYCGWDVTVVRLVAVLAIFFGVGTPILAYFIGWIVMPESAYELPVQMQTPGNGPGAAAS
jgi:phage shock protein C